MNWRDVNKSQVRFVKEQSEAINSICLELEAVARRLEELGGSPAMLIQGIIISAKESLRRIDDHDFDAVFMDNVDHFREKLEREHDR